jgi:NADH-quinone oxidoreductase subunit E
LRKSILLFTLKTMRCLSKDQVIKIMDNYGNDSQQLIAVLLDIQTASGKNYVERQWAELAADVLNISLSKIYDVLTFYSMFSTQPRGEYVIEICKSAPCHFAHSEGEGAHSEGVTLAQWFEEAAGIAMGETTADGKISLFYTSCFGACDIAPAVKIGDNVFGNLTQEKAKMLVNYCRQGKIQELESLCQN